ncbi:hypothetical protein D3C81_2289040 [compost metagenome]
MLAVCRINNPGIIDNNRAFIGGGPHQPSEALLETDDCLGHRILDKGVLSFFLIKLALGLH